jgi:hypothetical protein
MVYKIEQYIIGTTSLSAHMCGVISPRFNVKQDDIEKWVAYAERVELQCKCVEVCATCALSFLWFCSFFSFFLRVQIKSLGGYWVT